MISPNKPIFDFAAPMVQAARKAGEVVMTAFNSGLDVSYKSDRSPVTQADLAAEEVILKALQEIMPGVPVVAEETVAGGHIPRLEDVFFLVDPIDGTKGFARGDKDFTVNIALVAQRRPLFGVVYASALELCYVTLAPDKVISFRLPYADTSAALDLAAVEMIPDAAPRHPSQRVAIVSRSSSEQNQAFFAEHQVSEVIKMSSSLKFGMLVSGHADLYPRFGPTSEWDIAAGHAILQARGGGITTMTGDPFLYGKSDRNFLNSAFLAWRQMP